VLLVKGSCRSVSGRQKVQLRACLPTKAREKPQAGMAVAQKGLEESYSAKTK